MFSAIVAGTAADIDWLSLYGGPSIFLTRHRASLHSIVLSLLFPIALVVVLGVMAHRWGGTLIPLGSLQTEEVIPEDPAAKRNFVLRRFSTYVLGAPICAALLHIAMDSCQSDGVMLFWPFSSARFATDWLPSIDPWILTILIAAIALPELFHLVTSEIGAKAKKPRGQTGAIIGLALVIVYVGVRATLHSNVIALMQSRTFHGETPRRVSAFPESLSLLAWHGVVETESALNEIDVDVSSPDKFDADSSLRQFKPEPSPALDAARSTAVARRFLATAQIPKASLEKTETGYVVILRDLRYGATGETQHEIAAVIQLDLNNQVKSQELIWARDLHR